MEMVPQSIHDYSWRKSFSLPFQLSLYTTHYIFRSHPSAISPSIHCLSPFRRRVAHSSFLPSSTAGPPDGYWAAAAKGEEAAWNARKGVVVH